VVGAAAPHKMASGSGVDPVELVNELTSFATTVPDELTQYVLGTVGVELQDPGLVRLVSLAAQRFLFVVMNDTLQLCKRRVKAEEQRAAKARKQGGQMAGEWALTTEDLSNALREHGINYKLPPYFLDRQGSGMV